MVVIEVKVRQRVRLHVRASGKLSARHQQGGADKSGVGKAQIASLLGDLARWQGEKSQFASQLATEPTW